MAGDACGVRIEERLKIKIAEAKNLPPRANGVHKDIQRDTFCVLSLDQEEIFRTATMERTLNPFFVEEFQFEVPRHFKHLSIYVFDRDKHLKQEKVLGKVAIRRDELKNYNNKDFWFALRPVDADSEVQGKAHIEILFEESYPKITSISPDPDAASPKMSHRNMDSYTDRNPLSEMTASNLSVDRKVSKSKKITEYYKENIKFGSCSSNSSKKLLTAVTIPENLSNLTRSESLKSGNLGLHNTFGPSSSQNKEISMNVENLRSQQSLNTFIPSDPYVHPSLEQDYTSDYNPYISFQQSPSEEQTPQMDLKNKLSVKVLECSELTMKNGQCDPYAIVSVVYANNKFVSKKTKVKKKTVNPKFDECFVFDLFDRSEGSKESSGGNTYNVLGCTSREAEACEVCVSLWHEGTGGATFLGEVRASLRTTPHQAALNTSAWYCLRSRGSSQQCPRGATPPGTRLSSMAGPTSLGSLRLHLHHTLDRVLPPAAYTKLKALLLKQPKPIITSAVYILGEITNKIDAAQPLVRLLTSEDVLVPMIKALAEAELASVTDPTTIFRGNTLVSKMMDEAMRLTGVTYLQQTIKPVLDAIVTERKACEIDPTRFRDKDQNTIESNLENLRDYVEKMFRQITTSYVYCPPIMCRLFDVLRQAATHRFPNHPDVKYSVVSGFIFLRFFAPAILGPRLFDLTTDQLDPQTNRTLTLISKSIQSLGNLTSSQLNKEEYMLALFKCFTTERHIQAIKSFLEIISSRTCEKQHCNALETPVLLKEGSMKIRSQKRFGRSNLKQRHFRLTNCELSYSKARGKKPICSIPLTEIDIAEPVPEATDLNMNNMFQIKSKERILYVQAGNCVERKEWLYLLGKLCEGNTPNAKERYHPGNYTRGQWTCCLSHKSDAVGCGVKEGTASPPPNLRLHLDPARDLQRIHCLLYSNIDLIDTMHKSPGCQQSTILGNIAPEDFPQYQATLKEMLDVTFKLEDQHRAYQRLVVRETKYGSKQAPIGDDNYLNLSTRSNMQLDSMQQMGQMSQQPYRMLHSATTPQLHTTTSPPSNSYFLPYASPNLRMKFDKPLPIAPEPPPKNTDSTYHTNSFYSNSSIDSKVQDEERIKFRSSDSSSNDYLKMSKGDDGLSDSNKVTNIRISPTQEMLRKDRISESGLEGHSEYVEVKPKVPERDTKPTSYPIIPPKTINKANTCAEYELMSNFSSIAKNRHKQSEVDPSDDTPPAVPPRSHHSTPNKILFNPSPKLLDDIDDVLLHVCNLNRATTLRIVEDGDEIEDRSVLTKRSDSPQVRSQLICDSDSEVNCSVKVTHQSSLSNWCTQDSVSNLRITNECETAISGGDTVVTTDQTDEVTGKKQKNKDDGSIGFFSRKNVQRKSIPKSKKLSTASSSESSSSSIVPLKGNEQSESATSTKTGLSDRLTPSFFKKKSKVATSTDNLRLPPIC